MSESRPIDRLLAATRRQKPFAEPGSCRNLVISIESRSDVYADVLESCCLVKWETLRVKSAEVGEWEPRSARAPTLDEACAIAADQIEAAA